MRKDLKNRVKDEQQIILFQDEETKERWKDWFYELFNRNEGGDMRHIDDLEGIYEMNTQSKGWRHFCENEAKEVGKIPML